MHSVNFWLTALAGFARGAMMASDATSSSMGPLYGYGDNINGLQVFASASENSAGTGVLACVGNASTAGGKSLNWTQKQYSSYNNSYIVDGDSQGSLFYIERTSDTFAQAGFLQNENTISTPETTTTGFFFFSGMLSYLDGDEVESQFWAVASTTFEGIYDVVWNSDGQDIQDGTPLVLKFEAPY